MNSNVATVVITVNAVNDAPVVVSSPATQSVQYSDPITLTATDADNNALSLSTAWKLAGQAKFHFGLPGNLTLTAGTPYTWSLTGKMLVAPGVYVVRITAYDKTLFFNNTGYTDLTITVTREEARITYTGTTFAFTPSVYGLPSTGCKQ